MLPEAKLLSLPVSSIKDSWCVKQDGREYGYLFVKVEDGQQTVLVEKKV